MKKLLWQEVQELLKTTGYAVDDYTAKQIREFENIRWKDNAKEDVNSYLRFYKAIKYDLEHHHGVFASDNWMLPVVTRHLYEKKKQKIIGVYETSDEIAHAMIMSAISFIDGFSNSISFSLAPTKEFTDEISWRLECGILPNRINGFTSRRIHKVFKGWKVHLIRKRYKNGMNGRWIAGIRAAEEE